jgi:hypothetical protein
MRIGIIEALQNADEHLEFYLASVPSRRNSNHQNNKHQHLIINFAAVLGQTERKSPNNAKPFSLAATLF